MRINQEINERVESIHAVSTIKNLKFKYWNACDLKKPADILTEQLKNKKQSFIIEPKVRFSGQPGEQRTMFLKDPSGNALEFKAFKNLDNLFAT